MNQKKYSQKKNKFIFYHFKTNIMSTKASILNPIKTTEEKYMEMFNVLPPHARGNGAFLVGEPSDHLGEDNNPRFQWYWRKTTENEGGEKEVEYFDIWLMTTQKFDDFFNVYDLKRLLKLDFGFDGWDTRIAHKGEENERTVKVYTGSMPDLERYFFDGRLKTRHWRFQVDTTQDAPYFGMRCNLWHEEVIHWVIQKPVVVEYVEGDIYIVEFEHGEDIAWYLKDCNYFRGIDAWLSEARQSQVDSFCKRYGITNYKEAEGKE